MIQYRLPISFSFPFLDDDLDLHSYSIFLRLLSHHHPMQTLSLIILDHSNPRPTHYLPIADVPRILVTLDPSFMLLLTVIPALKVRLYIRALLYALYSLSLFSLCSSLEYT